MKIAYNQHDAVLFLTNFNGIDPCNNCIFIRPKQNYTCILADFRKDVFEPFPHCGNNIFIPEHLSNIFEL